MIAQSEAQIARRPFARIWEAAIRFDPALSPTVKITALEIASYINGDDRQQDQMFATQARIGAAVNKSERTVHDHLRVLYAEGWLKQVERGIRGRASTYRLTLPTPPAEPLGNDPGEATVGESVDESGNSSAPNGRPLMRTLEESGAASPPPQTISETVEDVWAQAERLAREPLVEPEAPEDDGTAVAEDVADPWADMPSFDDDDDHSPERPKGSSDEHSIARADRVARRRTAGWNGDGIDVESRPRYRPTFANSH